MENYVHICPFSILFTVLQSYYKLNLLSSNLTKIALVDSIECFNYFFLLDNHIHICLFIRPLYGSFLWKFKTFLIERGSLLISFCS